MKTKYLILTIFTGIGLFFSCTKENTNPVLHPDEITKPQITVPVSDTSYILSRDNADAVLDTFSWSKSDYGIPLGISYIVEVDTTGNNFKNSEILYSGYDISFTITHGDMNNKMIALDLPFDTESVLDVRVASVINGYDTIYSPVVNISVTPYSDVIPIYLLGDATSAGWNNTAAIEMTNISTGVYEITIALTPSTGDWIKFIAVLGQWAPQWGTDASGTWDTGNLVYRPTESEPDPPAIPAPPSDGTYLIHADISNLTYTVTLVTK